MAPHIVRVSTQELQERFEEEGLRDPDLFGIDAIEASVGAPGPDAPPDLSVGSVSIMLSYRMKSTGEEVAEAHVYRYAEGSYRGTPDPKMLRIGATIYLLDRSLDAGYIDG